MRGEQFWSRAYSRFLSTDGSLVPVSAGAEVFLFCSHDLLKGTDIWAMGGNKKHFKKNFLYIFAQVLYKIGTNTISLEQKKWTPGFSSQGRCVFKPLQCKLLGLPSWVPCNPTLPAGMEESPPFWFTLSLMGSDRQLCLVKPQYALHFSLPPAKCINYQPPGTELWIPSGSFR